MFCDCCGEEWEAAFFCEECSSVGELVETRQPKLFWDYIGDDMEDVEEVIYRSVCLNCCICHHRDKGQVADDKEVRGGAPWQE